MKIEFVATNQLSDTQKESLKQLRAAVYPTAALGTLLGKQITRMSPQWSIFVWDENELVSRVGLLTREIISNGETKIIGGVLGPLKPPQREHNGDATEAIHDAVPRLHVGI